MPVVMVVLSVFAMITFIRVQTPIYKSVGQEAMNLQYGLANVSDRLDLTLRDGQAWQATLTATSCNPTFECLNSGGDCKQATQTVAAGTNVSGQTGTSQVQVGTASRSLTQVTTQTSYLSGTRTSTQSFTQRASTAITSTIGTVVESVNAVISGSVSLTDALGTITQAVGSLFTSLQEALSGAQNSRIAVASPDEKNNDKPGNGNDKAKKKDEKKRVRSGPRVARTENQLPVQCIYDQGGVNVLFDERNPKSGFTFDGKPCNEFNPDNPDSTCVFRPVISWVPKCTVSPCIDPKYEVEMRFEVASSKSWEINTRAFTKVIER